LTFQLELIFFEDDTDNKGLGSSGSISLLSQNLKELREEQDVIKIKIEKIPNNFIYAFDMF
jgi:hypothetical protein